LISVKRSEARSDLARSGLMRIVQERASGEVLRHERGHLCARPGQNPRGGRADEPGPPHGSEPGNNSCTAASSADVAAPEPGIISPCGREPLYLRQRRRVRPRLPSADRSDLIQHVRVLAGRLPLVWSRPLPCQADSPPRAGRLSPQRGALSACHAWKRPSASMGRSSTSGPGRSPTASWSRTSTVRYGRISIP
jgi:hypothetical protein